MREMNAGMQPVIGVADTMPGPGTHMIELSCPRSITTAMVRLEMVDENGLMVTVITS